MVTPAAAIKLARGTFWDAVLTRDKKPQWCDNPLCQLSIPAGQLYIDPFPGRAFAWRDNSNFHFCLTCVGGLAYEATIISRATTGSDEAA